MNVNFTSAFVLWSTRSSTLTYTCQPRNSQGVGRTLIDFDDELRIRPANMPRKLTTSFEGEIDLSKIFCGYYRTDVARCILQPKGLRLEHKLPDEVVDTIILTAGPNANIDPLDIRDGEMAIIVAGKNAQTISRSMKLKDKMLPRQLDEASGRTFASRRLEAFGLSSMRPFAMDDVAGTQPGSTLPEPKTRITTNYPQSSSFQM